MNEGPGCCDRSRRGRRRWHRPNPDEGFAGEVPVLALARCCLLPRPVGRREPDVRHDAALAQPVHLRNLSSANSAVACNRLDHPQGVEAGGPRQRVRHRYLQDQFDAGRGQLDAFSVRDTVADCIIDDESLIPRQEARRVTLNARRDQAPRTIPAFPTACRPVVIEAPHIQMPHTRPIEDPAEIPKMICCAVHDFCPFFRFGSVLCFGAIFPVFCTTGPKTMNPLFFRQTMRRPMPAALPARYSVFNVVQAMKAAGLEPGAVDINLDGFFSVNRREI